MNRFFFILGLLLVDGMCSHVLADIKPSALFSDHLVLQSGMTVPVWGTSDPDEAIIISLRSTDGRKVLSSTKTVADTAGKWICSLKPLRSGGPYTMVLAGKNKIVLNDVLVGEVWFASGQSNMDFSVSKEHKYFAGVQNEQQEIAAANYPLLREFVVDYKMSRVPETDLSGHWSVCSPQTVGDFSAVGYFFQRDIWQDRHSPVGMIVSAFGASTAEAWINRETLTSDSKLKPLLDYYDILQKSYSPDQAQADYNTALQVWQKAVDAANAAGKRAPRKPRASGDPTQNQHNATVLWNGMVAPVQPFAIRGAIWYQGESNGPSSTIYSDIMTELITSWRQQWNEGPFPFLFVQIAPYRAPTVDPNTAHSVIARIRDQQLKTLTIPNTGMATTIDIGDATNIHPKDKQDVGLRLSLIARAKVYGEKIEYYGPMYTVSEVEGNTVRLHFTHADGGLVCKGQSLTGFAIAGSDHKYFWGDAHIDGDTVIVSSPLVTTPTSVYYAWGDNPTVSLYNKSGLPAPPFRTDSDN